MASPRRRVAFRRRPPPMVMPRSMTTAAAGSASCTRRQHAGGTSWIETTKRLCLRSYHDTSPVTIRRDACTAHRGCTRNPGYACHGVFYQVVVDVQSPPRVIATGGWRPEVGSLYPATSEAVARSAPVGAPQWAPCCADSIFEARGWGGDEPAGVVAMKGASCSGAARMVDH